MRVMAIDYGDARTGVAVSDATATICGAAFTLREGSRGHTCNGIHLRETLQNDACCLQFYKRAQIGVRQCLAIVTIEGRVPSAGPREGIVGLKFDGLDVQQLGRKDFL